MKTLTLYLLLFAIVAMTTFTVVSASSPPSEDVVRIPWQDYKGIIRI